MKRLIFFTLLLVVLLGCTDSSDYQQITSNNKPQVGFFAPGRVNEAFAEQVDIQLYNLHTPEALQENLQMAAKHGLKLFIAMSMPPKFMQDIATSYHFEGEVHEKQLSPALAIKLRRAVPRALLEEKLMPFLMVMQHYPEAIEAVFLNDEPYLNGISFEDLDQLALDTRILLDRQGLEKVKIGAVFASAMFNKEFAQHLDKASSAYAYAIDKYFLSIKEKEATGEAAVQELQWLDDINRFRLTTYDKANNMYVGGGLPTSLDIVGFDFYLSTLLQDGVHNESLAWFAEKNLHPACKGFKKSTIHKLRNDLSFWDAEEKMTDNLALQAKQTTQDKVILDQWYTCRTESVLALLYNEIKQSGRLDREVLLVSESSTNGVMAFDRDGNRLANQQMDLSHTRVVDEVVRAFDLVEKHPINHLLFFTYETETDYSINLTIDGAEGIPQALHLIYQNAWRNHEPLSSH